MSRAVVVRGPGVEGEKTRAMGERTQGSETILYDAEMCVSKCIELGNPKA